MDRLRLYVLRSQVELTDVTPAYRIDGVIAGDLPPVNRAEASAGRTVLGLPDDGETPGRALVLSARDRNAPAGALPVAGTHWQLSAIDAGIPMLYPPTQGLFVPQMLNLHWLMAVDFDKGCYPGQEVIARLHYRGTLTRRLFRTAWTGSAEPAPGEAVTDGAGTRAGTVVRAAAANDGHDQGRLLAVLKLDAVDALFTDAAALELLDLPYPTPA
jgi:folate-binding protein YgfZ